MAACTRKMGSALCGEGRLSHVYGICDPGFADSALSRPLEPELEGPQKPYNSHVPCPPDAPHRHYSAGSHVAQVQCQETDLSDLKLSSNLLTESKRWLAVPRKCTDASGVLACVAIPERR